MRIDLSLLLNGRVKQKDISYSFVPEVTDDGVILPDDITLSAPICVEGSICDNNGYMTLRCNVSAEYVTQCARCLDEINTKTEFVFERVVAVDKKMVDRDAIDEDNVLYISDGAIDFDGDIIEELSLELPTYHLCREDCPGLCPKCGKHLSDGDCGCKEEKEIDPRLAILKKLLDNPEEM